MSKKTIHINDAVKITAPPGFSVMIKPVGAECNLNCGYCYYLDKKSMYNEASAQRTGRFKIMDFDTLEQIVNQYINDTSSAEITFVWHGGEPLLAGMEFYKMAIHLQEKYSRGKIIKNALQTNGTLINRDWADFFASNDFLIGISVDGPEDIHNYYRKSGGVGTFARVIRGLNLLNEFNVEFNTLTVLTKISEGKAVEIYNFLKSTGTNFMQFLPAVDFVNLSAVNDNSITDCKVPADWNISPRGYGEFMSELFFEWLSKDVGNIFIQHFEVILGIYYGLPSSLCSYAETCGDSIVVEHTGDVFSCDHFVTQKNLLGNIKNCSLVKMASSLQQREFGFNKRDLLPDECFECNFLFACRGGCPKHRFPVYPKNVDSEYESPSKYFLCEGQKILLSNIGPYLDKMAKRLRNGESL